MLALTYKSARRSENANKKSKKIQKNERKSLWTLAVTSQCRIKGRIFATYLLVACAVSDAVSDDAFALFATRDRIW
jgi:hypothetical protein